MIHDKVICYLLSHQRIFVFFRSPSFVTMNDFDSLDAAELLTQVLSVSLISLHTFWLTSLILTISLMICRDRGCVTTNHSTIKTTTDSSTNSWFDGLNLKLYSIMYIKNIFCRVDNIPINAEVVLLLVFSCAFGYNFQSFAQNTMAVDDDMAIIEGRLCCTGVRPINHMLPAPTKAYIGIRRNTHSE